MDFFGIIIIFKVSVEFPVGLEASLAKRPQFEARLNWKAVREGGEGGERDPLETGTFLKKWFRIGFVLQF